MILFKKILKWFLIVFVIVFIVGKVRQAHQENSIPVKDRYLAPPTPTITKVAPPVETKTPTSTSIAKKGNTTSSTSKSSTTKK